MVAFDNPFINTLSGIGGQYGPLGFGDIGLASNQFRTLLGGSRQAIAQQYAPTLNQMLDTAAATRRNRAANPGRTGGAAASDAAAQDRLNQQMASITGQAQTEAPKELANIGATAAQIQANAIDNAASLAQNDINSRRAAHAAMWSALIGGAASLGAGFLTKGAKTAADIVTKGGGGGGGGGTQDPTPTGTNIEMPFGPSGQETPHFTDPLFQQYLRRQSTAPI